jgi:dipeptidyl aminopeptidase/acylaminoacyl peptidase
MLALLLFAGAAATVPTIDQSLSFRTASNPRISPDARYVAYVMQQTDWEENAFETEIWIYSAATGERYQLTSGKKSSWAPVWSPDSKLLAFLSDRDGKAQIYTISPTGGEAVALTKDEAGVTSYDWSPDGKRIAFLSTGPEEKTRKERREKYGSFAVEDEDPLNARLWIMDAAEKAKPEAVSRAEQFHVRDLAFSPDSTRIAFTAARDADPSSSESSDLYVLRLTDQYLKKLADLRGPESNPVWSPDSKQIAFETANGAEFFYHQNRRIGIAGVDGGSPQILAADFDESPSLVAWSPEGIYFTALQRTTASLFRLDPVSGKPTRVAGDARFSLSSISFTADWKRCALSGAPPDSFFELYVSPTASFEPKAITDLSSQYKNFQLATRELIQWKSSDGTPIEGVLYKPAGYDPSRRYPLLVVIHGGPTGIDRPFRAPDRTYPLELLAAKGALVLRPNYRGSAGYGEAFRSLNVRNLGVGDAWDVISGVDALVEKGVVDRNRVGAMGWSQGGYISAFLTCSSDRFKAVSVGAGISDWMTYYVNTDIHPFTRHYLRATPWDDPEIYQRTSPISYVQSAKTPTLIQHGDQDRRVPIPNAYQLYQALRDRNVPVRLVVYKGFGHGINKPKEQRHLMEENYEWFSRHLWGEQPAAAVAPAK